jgi:signal transduction histidine kinase
MNLQSNALKFTKDGGSIKIICEFIKGVDEDAPIEKKKKGAVLEKFFLDSFTSEV